MPHFSLLKDIRPPSHGEMGKTPALGRLKHVQIPETPSQGLGQGSPPNVHPPSVLPLHPRTPRMHPRVDSVPPNWESWPSP